MNNSELLIYQSPDGRIKVDVRLEDETVWLTQAGMAELFQVKPQNITIHLKNIYAEGELEEAATCKDFLQVQTEGTRQVERRRKFYNLDAIISVGYRIQSHVATQFRIWATQRLREYIVKGFALNDERFKSGNSMNYFSELQERIREIRLSERFFYQKVKDIYATSIDYNPKDEKTVEFFKVVQNKLLWAISQQTAAELVYRRADAALPLMGMQSFDKKGEVAVRKKDVSIAKNYLTEDEMKDWIQRLDAIIHLNGRELLTHAGKISHQMALDKSTAEYENYRENQRRIQHEKNLAELEEDIKKLAPPRKREGSQ